MLKTIPINERGNYKPRSTFGLTLPDVWKELKGDGLLRHCPCGKKISAIWHCESSLENEMTKCGPCFFNN